MTAPRYAGDESTPPTNTLGVLDLLVHAWRILRSYQTIILGGCLAIGLVTFSYGLWTFLTQPTTVTAQLPFRLEFPGQREGKYPSDMAFNIEDIVAAPVLLKVHSANKIDAYVPFGPFASAFFVKPTSLEAELLQLDYQARLSDNRLSPPERTRLELEYKAKLAGIQFDYTLVWLTPAESKPIPQAILAKVLNDVLVTWADMAALRGALSSESGALGPAIFSEADRTDLVLSQRANSLRGALTRLRENVAQMIELPGGRVVRTAKDKTSLPEIQGHLDELLRNDLVRLTTGAALRSASPEAIGYFETQRDLAQRDLERAANRQQSIQLALDAYSATRAGVSPSPSAQNSTASAPVAQLSESFLDRLLQLNGGPADQKFREDMANRLATESMAVGAAQSELRYYTSVLATIRQGSRNSGADSNSDKAFLRVREEANKAVMQVNELYEAISTQNLNPRGKLYSVVGAFGYGAARPWGLVSLLKYGVLIGVLTPLLLALLCLIHAVGRIVDKRPTPSLPSAKA